jgi:HEAT repeats
MYRIDPQTQELLVKVRKGDTYAKLIARDAVLSMPFDTLAILIKDNSPEVRDLVASALGKLGDKRAVQLLLSLKEKNTSTKNTVVKALGKLGDSSAFEYLKDAIDDLDVGVACSAVIALGELNDNRVINLLLNRLESYNSQWSDKENNSLKDFILLTLAEFNDQKVLPTLEYYAKNARGKNLRERPLKETARMAIQKYNELNS